MKERTMSQKEKLLRTLFDDPKREHVNMKFCRGSSDTISEEALCAQANTAIFEFENGLLKAHSSAAEDFGQIDVRNLQISA
jgi:hypothetical protein